MAAGIQADVDAVFPNLDCLTSEKKTGCNSIQDGVRFKSWVPILLWENGSSRNKQDYRGVSLKDEHVCRVRCHVVFVLTSNDVEMESVLTWRFVYRCRSFPSQAWKDEGQCLKSKDGRPYQYIAGFKANHKTTRIHQAFFNKLVFAALFGRQQGSLVFGAVEGWAPQIFPTFARVPVPLSLRLRNCHTGSSNKCEPYDFAVNGEGGVVEVILTFLESVGPFWCAIYLRFVLSSFIPSLWALEYHWNIIAFCYYCWFNWFVVSLCPLSLEPGHAFDTFHVWDSMGVSDAPRDTDSGFPAS